ncbi:unnamed protein product, partial [Symbiodinium microadriaticum]
MEAANRVVLLEIKAGTMLPHDPAERISPPLMRKEEPAKILFCFRGRDPAPTLLTKAVQVGVDQLDWED